MKSPLPSTTAIFPEARTLKSPVFKDFRGHAPDHLDRGDSFKHYLDRTEKKNLSDSKKHSPMEDAASSAVPAPAPVGLTPEPQPESPPVSYENGEIAAVETEVSETTDGDSQITDAVEQPIPVNNMAPSPLLVATAAAVEILSAKAIAAEISIPQQPSGITTEASSDQHLPVPTQAEQTLTLNSPALDLPEIVAIQSGAAHEMDQTVDPVQLEIISEANLETMETPHLSPEETEETEETAETPLLSPEPEAEKVAGSTDPSGKNSSAKAKAPLPNHPAAPQLKPVPGLYPPVREKGRSEVDIHLPNEVGIRNAKEMHMREASTLPMFEESDRATAAAFTPAAMRAAPARAAQAMEPVRLPQLIERIQQAIESQRPPQMRQLTFQIQPPALGLVQVDVRWTPQGWNVNLSVTQSEVRDWLAQQMPSLQQQDSRIPIVWNQPSLQTTPWDMARQHSHFHGREREGSFLADEEAVAEEETSSRPQEYWA